MSATWADGRCVSEALKLHGKMPKKSTPSAAIVSRSRAGIRGNACARNSAIMHTDAIA